MPPKRMASWASARMLASLVTSATKAPVPPARSIAWPVVDWIVPALLWIVSVPEVTPPWIWMASSGRLDDAGVVDCGGQRRTHRGLEADGAAAGRCVFDGAVVGDQSAIGRSVEAHRLRIASDRQRPGGLDCKIIGTAHADASGLCRASRYHEGCHCRASSLRELCAILRSSALQLYDRPPGAPTRWIDQPSSRMSLSWNRYLALTPCLPHDLFRKVCNFFAALAFGSGSCFRLQSPS